MKQYLDMVKYVFENGEETDDRTGVGTISVFGYQNRYDLREGFPILTTKKINLNSLKAELLWFLSGSTNINDLKKIYPTKIWDAWADEDGSLKKIYGLQWMRWNAYDPTSNSPECKMGRIYYINQIENVINSIKTNPNSRRHIVSAWNVAEIDQMNLPCCHVLFQFKVINGFLDLQLYQRSADLALGVPFNITSYSLLLSIIANECGLIPRYFIHSFGDLHIYKNHFDGLKIQLDRVPKKLPKLKITNKSLLNKKGLCNFNMNDIELIDYEYDPWIKFEVAV